MLDSNELKPFSFQDGNLPILVSFPHEGSRIPSGIENTMTEAGRTSQDTDWFLTQLYDVPELEQAYKIASDISRYVIDLNRSKTNESLYPGQTKTGLVPELRFAGKPIYKAANWPITDLEDRVQYIWEPYHQKLKQTLELMAEEFGCAVLIEAHSIRSSVPRLFEGTLPDFNIGTNRGQSCDQQMEQLFESVLNSQSNYSYVINGRFVGGYITRQYGNPSQNIHALQIELSQATYLDESSAVWSTDKSAKVQPVFRHLFQSLLQWIQQQ